MPLKLLPVVAYLCLSMAGTTLSASEMCIKVLDETGLPLPHARVQASNLSTQKSWQKESDSQGNACFLKIPEGLYAVDASLQGFLTARYYPLPVFYPEKSGLTIRLPLSNLNGDTVSQEITLSGTLTENRRPAEGVSICLFRSDGTQVACATTNDLGEYAITAAPGIYEVELKPYSGNAYRSKIDLSTPGALYRNDLKLPSTRPKSP